MKYYLFALCVLLFISCQNDISEHQKYQNKVTSELQKGIRSDTAFLGFRFGMTAKEVSRKTAELIDSNKLNKNGSYTMPIDEDGNVANAILSFKYQNDILYQIDIEVKGEGIYLNSQILTSRIYIKYIRKYGGAYELSDYSYAYVNNNQAIEIRRGAFDFAFISYIDTSVKTKIDAEENKENKNQYKKASDDI